MIDYKNYNITKKNKNSLLSWIIFALIITLLWITTIEMLFK